MLNLFSLAYPFVLCMFLSYLLVCDDHIIGGSRWRKCSR